MRSLGSVVEAYVCKRARSSSDVRGGQTKKTRGERASPSAVPSANAWAKGFVSSCGGRWTGCGCSFLYDFRRESAKVTGSLLDGSGPAT
ncbi:hypothetical protein MRX96_012257 [Rhipicephalus microplus]